MANLVSRLNQEIAQYVARGMSPTDAAGAPTPTIVVRTTLDPESLLQQTLGNLGTGLPVIRARTMPQHLAESLGGCVRSERCWAFSAGLAWP